jgi:DNA topoisomerase-1
MMRLRRVSCDRPGWTRRRRGRGWSYLDQKGQAITDPATLARLRDLVIPPAWTDVWICPDPRGHLQAVGTDAAGRRQYLYHPQWREHRDREKHARVLEVARRLPEARAAVARELDTPGLTRRRVLACAFRLLDLGFFRIGGEDYAQENGTYGLATLRREHVTVHRDGSITFDYVAKSGVERTLRLSDPQVYAVIAALARRERPGQELLAYQDEDGTWRDVTTADVNEYVKEHLGDASAKDFRTWHATVLAAMALAVSTPTLASTTARKRAVARAMKEVSTYLGNTPAVAKASYVDPRLVDLFHDGCTIEPALREIGEGAPDDAPGTQGAVEDAVLELLTGRPPTPAESLSAEPDARASGTRAEHRRVS